MKDLVVEWQAEPICDFCGAKRPTWRYECADFDMSEIAPWGSNGAFAACDTCSQLSSSTTSGVFWRVVPPLSEEWHQAHRETRYTWL